MQANAFSYIVHEPFLHKKKFSRLPCAALSQFEGRSLQRFWPKNQKNRVFVTRKRDKVENGDRIESKTLKSVKRSKEQALKPERLQ
jgi:hypothetical protein